MGVVAKGFIHWYRSFDSWKFPNMQRDLLSDSDSVVSSNTADPRRQDARFEISKFTIHRVAKSSPCDFPGCDVDQCNAALLRVPLIVSEILHQDQPPSPVGR